MKAPRAQRLPLDAPLRYRLAQEAKWHSGRVMDFSSTGMRFEADTPVPNDFVLEVCVQMPPGASNDHRVMTFFRARVVRSLFPLDARQPGQIGVALLDGWLVRETPSGDWEVLETAEQAG